MKYILAFIFLFSTLIGFTQTNTTWDLQQCIAYAKENNITVKQAALNSSVAAANLERAENQRYPDLTGGASIGFTNGTSIDPITSEYVNQQISSSNFSLNSQVSLYSGGQLKTQISQNQLLLTQNELYKAEAQNEIVLSVTEAYLQILYLKENIAIAEYNLATSTQQLAQAQARYDLGDLAAQDVADLRAQNANDSYQLVAATNSFKQQVLVLKQLLELEPQTNFAVDTTSTLLGVELVLPDLITVYQTAKSQLPQVKAGELDVQISQLDLAIAKAGYKPTLSANARLYTGQTSTRDINYFEQLNGNFNQQIGLSLSVPIFDRKQTSTQVQTALIGIQKAQLAQSTIDKTLYRTIETAWQSASSSLLEANAAQVVSEASKTAYDQARQQYDLGDISATDVLISKNNYINAEQQYLQARYSSILYYNLLQFYLGNELKI
ncbi:MAG: TolC family protein [Lewinella sp.]|uniref:TolC family protein n=1 Tax=Lewinella sp. TaxID=2004506 RepID=UPI003D6BDA65